MIGELNNPIEWQKVNYIFDTDVCGFFDSFNCDSIIKFVGSKISDNLFYHWELGLVPTI